MSTVVLLPLERPTAAFLTDSLPLASYLKARSHPVTLVETGSPKVLFSFPPAAGLNEDVAAFTAGTARVAPAAYDAARVSLRQAMDALRDGDQ